MSSSTSPGKKGAYLPQNNRVSGGINFSLTDRDLEILKMVNTCRYVQTNQVWRLVFPGNQSMQSCRRRLKYLYHNRFLDRVIPFIQAGHGSGETAYFLGELGRALLTTEGEEILPYAQKGQVKQTFLQHALGITEFRIHLEIALRGHEVVALHRFVADFELKHNIDQLKGKRRYKLYDEVIHHLNRQTYVVYPDALIVLKGRGEYEKHQRLFFLEVDRGTMGLHQLREKVIGYNLYRNLKVYQKFGKFNSFTVLIQTSSPQRAENIRKSLIDLEGADLVWVTSFEKVKDDTIVSDAIWVDHELKARQIVKVTSQNPQSSIELN